MGVEGEEDSLVFQCSLLPSGLIELWEERTPVCCLLSSHIWHKSKVLTWNCTLTWHGTQNAFVVSVIQVTRSFMWSHISQALTSQFPFQSKPTNARQIHAHLMSTWLGHAHNYPQLSLSLSLWCRQFWSVDETDATGATSSKHAPVSSRLTDPNPTESLSMCLSLFLCVCVCVCAATYKLNVIPPSQTRFLRSHKSTPVGF